VFESVEMQSFKILISAENILVDQAIFFLPLTSAPTKFNMCFALVGQKSLKSLFKTTSS